MDLQLKTVDWILLDCALISAELCPDNSTSASNELNLYWTHNIPLKMSSLSRFKIFNERFGKIILYIIFSSLWGISHKLEGCMIWQIPTSTKSTVLYKNSEKQTRMIGREYEASQIQTSIAIDTTTLMCNESMLYAPTEIIIIFNWVWHLVVHRSAIHLN